MITICSHKQHHNACIVAVTIQRMKQNGSPSQVVPVAADQRQIYMDNVLHSTSAEFKHSLFHSLPLYVEPVVYSQDNVLIKKTIIAGHHHRGLDTCFPLPSIDVIWPVMTVQRIRGNIYSELFSFVLCTITVNIYKHTHMNRWTTACWFIFRVCYTFS